MENLLSFVWVDLHAKVCWREFGQGVKAMSNETTTAPYVHIPPLLPQRRETEVPKGNDLKKNSPNLIIYITALIIINIAWPLPLQNPSFQVFFFPTLWNCTFLRGIYWAQISSAVFWEQGKRRNNLALAYLQRGCISLSLCSQIPFDILACVQPKEKERKR